MPVYGEVLDVQRLTRNMVRVRFGGEGLDEFEPVSATDQYVNALFLPSGTPYAVPFDVDEARAHPPEHRPVGRRYTVRSWDPAGRILTIDFVVHGDVGHAGRWANHAKPGDLLQMLGPHGSYSPDPAADAHLMVGDESAAPSICAALENVPEDRPVQAVLIVDDADGHFPVSSPGALSVTWVHRCDSGGDGDQVLNAVRGLALPSGDLQVFVHGEAREVRAVRRYLLAEVGIPRDRCSISPYWRRGDNDEEWRKVKRQWLEESEADLA